MPYYVQQSPYLTRSIRAAIVAAGMALMLLVFALATGIHEVEPIAAAIVVPLFAAMVALAINERFSDSHDAIHAKVWVAGGQLFAAALLVAWAYIQLERALVGLGMPLLVATGAATVIAHGRLRRR